MSTEDQIEQQPDTGSEQPPVETPAAAENAAGPGATAAPESQPKPGDITFTPEQQARVNEIVADRLARDRMKREREAADAEARRAREAPKPPAAEEAAPKREDYDDHEEFLRDNARWEARKEVRAELEAREKAQREAKAREEFATSLKTHGDREDQARAKYADYEDVAYNPRLPITDAMHRAIIHSDDSAELLYYLGHNASDAERISRLHPIAQAAEIGKLSARLTVDPSTPSKSPASKPAPVSQAPEPIEPGSSKGGMTVSGKPPTDPNEYRAWRTAQREAEAKAARA